AGILISGLDEEIKFLQNERNGLAYIKTAREPVQLIQQHRGLTGAYLTGNDALRSRIMQKRDEVDSALNQLKQVDGQLGGALETGNALSAIQRQWGNIKDNTFSMQPAESLQSHSKLIADIMALVRRVADNSGITLDPSLDSYYLGDALVSRILTLTEAMGKSRAIGSQVASAGEFTQESFIRLSILDNEIQNNAQRLHDGLEAAFAANSGVAARLQSVEEKNNQAIHDMESLLRNELLNKETITINSKTFYDNATAAINQSYAL
ncbi:MAG: nitrate- and nitrite sensing domain-containing protein, partial [Pseudomonadota bacterium]